VGFRWKLAGVSAYALKDPANRIRPTTRLRPKIGKERWPEEMAPITGVCAGHEKKPMEPRVYQQALPG